MVARKLAPSGNSFVRGSNSAGS